MRDEKPDRSIKFWASLPTADLVGGVTFALAEKGEISIETANPQNVARICFALAELMVQPVAT